MPPASLAAQFSPDEVAIELWGTVMPIDLTT
jgi:hypothetical protein